MATVTEVSMVPQMETVHMKLGTKSSVGLAPHPPAGGKRRGKLVLDPQRALEPARKKLSTLEAERIMAVLVTTIRRIELVAALPNILADLERYRVSLGTDLVRGLEDHTVITASFTELSATADRLRQAELAAQAAAAEEEEEEGSQTDTTDPSTAPSPRPGSASSVSSQAQAAMRSLLMVAGQMQTSVRSVLRSFAASPSTTDAILKDQARSEGAEELLDNMASLREILLHMLLTTPTEESERGVYLQQISERERHNATVITRLEADLSVAMDDKDTEIRKKNDVIRRLQADLHQIEKFSEEHIRRTKSDAEKQEAADVKNSDGKKIKLQQDMTQLKTQQQNLVLEHREAEQNLRKKKFQVETEVENWIQKYDQDMGERQDEYEEIDAVYTEEKKQLNELEERFSSLEAEYTAIQEERRAARERLEAQQRELQVSVKAATTIQAFWRSFKVRKAIRGKRKGGKKGKKGKK